MSEMINPAGESGGSGNQSVPYLLTQIWQKDLEKAKQDLAALGRTQWRSPAATRFMGKVDEVRLALNAYEEDLKDVMARVYALDSAIWQADANRAAAGGQA